MSVADRPLNVRRGGVAIARLLIIVIIWCCLLVPLSALAQGNPVPRVGILTVAGGLSVDAFIRGLQALGYVDGKNIIIEQRLAGTPDRLPIVAAELVKLKVDVIFAPATANVKAARGATSTIPIVFAGVADPVGSGFATSLARPGGSITGLTAINAELGPKRIQLLKETVPRLARVGYLYESSDAVSSLALPEMETGARSLGVSVLKVDLRGADGLGAAFAGMTRDGVGAIVTGGGLFRFRAQIAELATRHRLPVLGDSRLWVEAGALLAYGASYEDLALRAASYVDRILKGVKPGELPIERPTRFEFLVNLKSAKALGLTVPAAVLVRADKVLD